MIVKYSLDFSCFVYTIEGEQARQLVNYAKSETGKDPKTELSVNGEFSFSIFGRTFHIKEIK